MEEEGIPFQPADAEVGTMIEVPSAQDIQAEQLAV